MYVLLCKDQTFIRAIRSIWRNESRLTMPEKGAKYTRVRTPVTLLYAKEFATKQEAMKAGSGVQEILSPEKETFLQTIGANVDRPVIIYLEGEHPHETTELSDWRHRKTIPCPYPIGNLEDMTFARSNALRRGFDSLPKIRAIRKSYSIILKSRLPKRVSMNIILRRESLKSSSGCKKEKASHKWVTPVLHRLATQDLNLYKLALKLVSQWFLFQGRMRELRLLSQADSFLNRSISMGSYHVKKRKNRSPRAITHT